MFGPKTIPLGKASERKSKMMTFIISSLLKTCFIKYDNFVSMSYFSLLHVFYLNIDNRVIAPTVA